MFGFEACLDAVPAAEPQFMHEPKLLFLSARCGIKFLIDTLRPAQVWMPSYLCCDIIDAVDPQVTELRFFEVGYDLEVTSLDWLDVLLPGSLVMLIDYFGFPCNDHVAKEAKARGAFILENATQALLSTHVGRQSDFLLFSPRKTLGVPDGGILRYLRDGALPPAHLIPPPQEWWLKALEACIARREFDRYGGVRRWFDLFRQLEAAYPLGPYRMSELSEMLLESVFDYPAIAQARRANYAYLAESFAEHALINRLDENTVPLGFPIRLRKRDEVRQFLFDHGVYPPVHWQIKECVPAQFVESHRLSAHIMTIPCDQRLGRDDVMRISDLLHRALGTQ
jgi:hypothetical protein